MTNNVILSLTAVHVIVRREDRTIKECFVIGPFREETNASAWSNEISRLGRERNERWKPYYAEFETTRVEPLAFREAAEQGFDIHPLDRWGTPEGVLDTIESYLMKRNSSIV